MEREPQEMETEDPLEELMPDLKNKMEERVAQAESQAYNAQQALLHMQCQLQQFMAFQMNATGNQAELQPPMPMPMETPPHPGHAASMTPGIPGKGSPQLPKGVRNATLKKDVGKVKDPKENTAKAKDTPKAVKPAAGKTTETRSPPVHVEPGEVINLEENEEGQASEALL